MFLFLANWLNETCGLKDIFIENEKKDAKGFYDALGAINHYAGHTHSMGIGIGFNKD